MVVGKFEGGNLQIFALVLFWVKEKACECPTSRMKKLFYPTPLIKGCKQPNLLSVGLTLPDGFAILTDSQKNVVFSQPDWHNIYILQQQKEQMNK